MSITVSVIIPTYGRSELLARAIDSVLAQTHRPLEIIVVDDNPQGDAHRLATRERLADYIERGEIIYYPRRRNGGGALARNSGILRSSGQYISFLDDDDYYHPQKIARQLAFMLQGDYDVSLCDMDILKNGQISAEHYYRARCEGLEDFMLAGVAYTPMIMMRRSTAIAVRGFFNTPRYQDHIFLYRLLAAGAKIGTLHERLAVHNDHDGERITSSPKGIIGYRNKMQFEQRLMPQVSPRARKIMRLRHTCITSRIITDGKSRLAGVFYGLKGIVYVNSGLMAGVYMKNIIRNVFFRGVPF
ncbi:glycosyltransferase family 2 protein [Serratia liquefaciens]|jgi:glycosyltransferase involved in cell wall biosynthesis|uniref:Glycosyltransferase family 2 protein n=1 Tax=Serratia liquefaciens TaxID=614 RepID=A0A515CU41_SERLI|nr:glycosyltransferase family 2 protein [Serratia liquefaciens]MBI6161682.1 glycosyltransferase family 2 protein [Serratia liquefaciens]QDL31643.1 glycosyltransferase family 2 protein [Serratia liquefaciens]RYM78232.1 glycosyl transferase [Serratia liquefaciens]RYM78667.1 glycosyl transferase [Serratia liquefaciens]